MAWQTTPVFAVGDVLTAGNMNILGGNINASAAGVVTTNGDTVYATGANALARLAAGVTDAAYRIVGGVPAWGGALYRKTTSKDVASTAAETDLLNSEITVDANVMSTNRLLRATLSGDYLFNNASGNVAQLKVKLGGTTLYDSGATNGFQPSAISANRMPWVISFGIFELGATNSQFLAGYIFYTKSGASGAVTTGLGPIANGASAQAAPFSSNGTTTVDTTAATALAVTITWTAASANNSFRLQGAYIEVV